MNNLPVSEWRCEDIERWLIERGFSDYTNLLCTQHQLDGPALLTLTENDLKQPPLQIKVLGDIKRLMICIRKLQLDNRHLIRNLQIRDESPLSRHRTGFVRLDSEGSTYSDELDQYDYVDADGRVGKRSQSLEPEYLKLVISYVYMFSAFLLTSYLMVIVHDRVPDMKRYPPLPDIVLDNMPYIPWAFEMCEFTGLTLGFIWGVILFFHKHRFILMRRMFSMAGTVFLLRCITILITSLSVPGTHLQCRPEEEGDTFAKLERAFIIWRGFGMSLQGVRTCGDYMFSGHTVMVTMFNFFITEYTPRRIYWLHTITWIMNIFGIFFILAAHEHYSIDVFIAFYITSRMFLYYHSLANNRALLQMDHKRTRIWFPLFSFFESKINGIVPNEYEWPLPWPRYAKEYFETKCNKKRN